MIYLQIRDVAVVEGVTATAVEDELVDVGEDGDEDEVMVVLDELDDEDEDAALDVLDTLDETLLLGPSSSIIVRVRVTVGGTCIAGTPGSGWGNADAGAGTGTGAGAGPGKGLAGMGCNCLFSPGVRFSCIR